MYSLTKEYLEKQHWLFSEVNDKEILLFGMRGKNGTFQCVANFFDEEKKFIFYAICGANVPDERRSELLILLNQLNYNFTLGNFEINENGEERFKTSFIYNYIQPNEGVVEQIIMTSIMTMDTYLPAIMGIMFGELSAAEAMELINVNLETV